MILPTGSKVITVDGSRMAIFDNIGKAFAPQLDLIEEYDHLSLRTSEMGTDRPGRTFQSASPRRGAHELTDLQQLEEDRFAVEAAERMARVAAKSKAGIVLVAAPRALSTIRKTLKPEVSGRLLAEIPKIFGPEDAEALEKMLVAHQL